MVTVDHYGSLSENSVRSGSRHGQDSMCSSFGDSHDFYASEKSPIIQRRQSMLNLTEDGPTHWLAGALIIVNSMIGAGLLTLPYGVIHSGGLLPGILSQVVTVGIAVGSGVILGLLKGRDKNIQSIQDVSDYYLGRIGHDISSSLLVILYFFACTAYLTAVRDQLCNLLTSYFQDSTDLTIWYFDGAKFFTALIVILIVGPLCFLPKIDHLKHICTVASACIIYIAGMVVAGFFDRRMSTGEPRLKQYREEPLMGVLIDDSGTPLYVSILYGVSTFTAAYCFQPTALIVYNSLAPKTFVSYTKTIAVAVVAAGVFYNIVVVFGILTFGHDTASQILLNYNSRNIFVLVGTISYTIELLLVCPLIHFTAREGILSLLKQRLYVPTGSILEFRVKIGIALVYLSTSLTLALLVPHVLVVIQFAGVFNAILVLIIPGCCLLKALDGESNAEDSTFKHFSTTLRTFLWLVGVFYVTFGTFIAGYIGVQAVLSVTVPPDNV